MATSEEPTPSRAQVKPAQGRVPAGENTVGLILPKTQTALQGASTNAWYEDLWEGYKKQALDEINESLGEPADPNSRPQGAWQRVGYALGGAATTVMDDARYGKGARGVRGVAPGRAPAKIGAQTQASAQPRKKDSPPQAKAAAGGGGGYSKGTRRRPKHGCELMKYKDMICDGEKHHVLPDWTLRTGSAKNKKIPATRIPGTPAHEDGLAICLSKAQHQGIHKTVDEKIGAAGRGGVVSMGKNKEISATEAAKKSGCNPKNIKKQLDRKIKAPDDTLVRAVKDSRGVTEEMKSKYGRPETGK